MKLKPIACGAAALCLHSNLANAELLYREPFDYALAPLATQNGGIRFTDTWGTGASDIEEDSLSYTEPPISPPSSLRRLLRRGHEGQEGYDRHASPTQ